jgi:aldehyde dehydrogenase (NAD+)
MDHHQHFYIDGQWVPPITPASRPVVNPATGEPLYEVALGSPADVDRAVAAARRAFESYSLTSREERIKLLQRIVAAYKARAAELAKAVTDEMGAPVALAERAQVAAGLGHLLTTLEVLQNYPFEERLGSAILLREPVGVVGMITPWNWPLNQIACKVAPALAAGCTMVLKPSEFTPGSALLFAEVLHEAGVPPGVFNLVNGLGPDVGAALSAHPGVDMISFTGSTRAGVDVAQRAAPTVKRVSQELGGKSPNVILEDADLQAAVKNGLGHAFMNSGQSCNAPTRMLVPRARLEEVVAIARAVAEGTQVGDPRGSGTKLGPVVSETQWNRIQALIGKGLEEGARLVAGGPGRPAGLDRGWYVQPTVFVGTNDMTIAREEIFGPVVVVIPYDDDEEAVRLANDTPYGLAGYVWGGSPERATAVARRIRAGNVNVNGAPNERAAPFGGYKQSGNGREWGRFGLEEFLEVKAVAGVPA